MRFRVPSAPARRAASRPVLLHPAAVSAVLIALAPALRALHLRPVEVPSPAAPSAAPARPVVLMLHGRGVQDADSTALRREWLDALNQGLVGVGAGALLGPEDLRLVWYADALDPRAPAACARAARQPAPEPGIASVLAAVGGLMGVAAELTGEHEAAALRSLAGDLLYLGDDRKRCAAEERLQGALARAAGEGRPVLLIAHSFGSLVAYRHLQTRDTANAPSVERLITIGSLIGRPELRELLLGAGGRAVGLPPRVGSWVNVADPEDPFAATLSGAAAGVDGSRMEDRRTERQAARDPHDASRYLLDAATARAVLEVWCAAEVPGAPPDAPARACAVPEGRAGP